MVPFFLITLFGLVHADYNCLCNYSTEKSVYATPSDTGQTPFGYLFEFDCKETIQPHVATNGWAAIAYEHQIGYVLIDSETVTETCDGQPPTDDKVTPKHVTVPTTTTQPSTTTTSPQPTHTTTTPKHTTSTTTQKPATTPRTTSTPKPIATTAPPQPTTPIPKYTTVTTESTVQYGTLACPDYVLKPTHMFGGMAFIDKTERKCFTFVPYMQTWDSSKNICQRYGGHLATINSITQNKLLHSYVQRYGHPAWIGLSDRNQEEHFTWCSGENPTFTNWQTGRQNFFFHSSENCVAMSSQTGTWDDTYCYSSHVFICEFAATGNGSPFLTTPTPTNYNTDGNLHICPPSVIQHSRSHGYTVGQYGKACYEIIDNDKVSWSHGENICKRHGGHLAYITNSNEQAFLEAFMSRHYRNAVWIGLHDLNSEGHFEWTSGEAVSFTNWIQNHIGNLYSHDIENCVVFVPYHNGIWDDIPCGYTDNHGYDNGEIYAILCQYRTSPHASSVLIG